MAPDKIYVKEFGEGISQMWSSIKATETTANAQHEYIRKDALREWLKKEMKEWSSESNTAQGVKMGLALVLDKIESL